MGILGAGRVLLTIVLFFYAQYFRVFKRACELEEVNEVLVLFADFPQTCDLDLPFLAVRVCQDDDLEALADVVAVVGAAERGISISGFSFC